ncbi:MAG: hypothetical protein ABI680_00340 [Chthoniobacteraceae bacterium]
MKRAHAIALLLLLPCGAQADGGVVRIRETTGHFIVTVFTPPLIAVSVPADVTVLVQDGATGEAILDASVDLRFTPPPGARLAVDPSLCGPLNNTVVLGIGDTLGSSPAIRATRAHATNKLLYGASVLLPATGDWRVQATVYRGTATSVGCTLPVAAAPRRIGGLWPYLAFPPVAIGLFALNQRLRRRSAEGILPAR